MHTFILSLHIGLATLLTITTVAVVMSAYKTHVTRAYPAMLYTFAGTLLSGVGLLVLGIGSFGRICATMTAVSLVVIASRYYYRSRVVLTNL